MAKSKLYATYIIFPGQMLKGDRVDILVEDEGEGNGKVEDGETLSAKLVGQDLNSVRYDEGREGETKN